MLYSKPDGVAFSMSWKITLIQVWLLFCLILLEKLISPSYQCRFEHEFRFVRVFFFFFNPKTTSLCSCYYFSINGLARFLFQHSDYFLKNNNMWVQGQHCQNLSCKITPGLTLNYRWQVCQIIWGKSKVRRLIFHVVVFGQQAFMEHSVKPSLYQVPQNIAIICKELTVW